ncbi:DUF2934 domain-containing protein [Skermanella rosea]|uniref:DUF2934 domain-containing protein n=1 Tax=Skermanella rosea TaxID=1817965 RepID=UPI001933A585|nr:DUF2934 domain-containing protein [Skermanella rosea]UEM05902.1 DUF2934 domain-containing protein [Skermanella rosea]
MSPEQEDRIKQRAYEIWEREGRPDGRGDVHWHMAVQEIRAEDGWVDDAADPAAPTDDLGRQLGSAEAALSPEGAAAEETPPAEAPPARKPRARKAAEPKTEEAPPAEPKAKGKKAAAPKAASDAPKGASEKPKRSAKA